MVNIAIIHLDKMTRFFCTNICITLRWCILHIRRQSISGVCVVGGTTPLPIWKPRWAIKIGRIMIVKVRILTFWRKTLLHRDLMDPAPFECHELQYNNNNNKFIFQIKGSIESITVINKHRKQLHYNHWKYMYILVYTY